MALANACAVHPARCGLDVSASAEGGATVIAIRGGADAAMLPVVCGRARPVSVERGWQ